VLIGVGVIAVGAESGGVNLIGLMFLTHLNLNSFTVVLCLFVILVSVNSSSWSSLVSTSTAGPLTLPPPFLTGEVTGVPGVELPELGFT